MFSATGGMKRQETGVLVGAAMIGICMIIFGIARAPFLLFVAAFVYGGAISLANASSQTIWQSRTPIEIQGRVFSIRRMIAWGLNPISILLSIPLAVAVFAPLLSVGLGVWNVGQIWGNGQFGTHASFGVFQPRHSRGRLLSFSAISSSCACVYFQTRPFGQILPK